MLVSVITCVEFLKSLLPAVAHFQIPFLPQTPRLSHSQLVLFFPVVLLALYCKNIN